MVERLKGRGVSTFGVYARSDWDKPQQEGGPSDAAKFVLGTVWATADGYTHDYVSDPDVPPLKAAG